MARLHWSCPLHDFLWVGLCDGLGTSPLYLAGRTEDGVLHCNSGQPVTDVRCNVQVQLQAQQAAYLQQQRLAAEAAQREAAAAADERADAQHAAEPSAPNAAPALAGDMPAGIMQGTQPTTRELLDAATEDMLEEVRRGCVALLTHLGTPTHKEHRGINGPA